jgi:hypothetical protein
MKTDFGGLAPRLDPPNDPIASAKAAAAHRQWQGHARAAEIAGRASALQVTGGERFKLVNTHNSVILGLGPKTHGSTGWGKIAWARRESQTLRVGSKL